MFRHADFGVCGLYQDILPELIERVKQGYAFGVTK